VTFDDSPTRTRPISSRELVNLMTGWRGEHLDIAFRDKTIKCQVRLVGVEAVTESADIHAEILGHVYTTGDVEGPEVGSRMTYSLSLLSRIHNLHRDSLLENFSESDILQQKWHLRPYLALFQGDRELSYNCHIPFDQDDIDDIVALFYSGSRDAVTLSTREIVERLMMGGFGADGEEEYAIEKHLFSWFRDDSEIDDEIKVQPELVADTLQSHMVPALSDHRVDELRGGASLTEKERDTFRKARRKPDFWEDTVYAILVYQLRASDGRLLFAAVERGEEGTHYSYKRELFPTHDELRSSFEEYGIIWD